MNLQENIPLKDHTTFKIGGPAEYFVEATTAQELQEAFVWAKENGKQVLILGGGSNMLISDQGYKGLVIKLKFDKLEFIDTKVIVGSGVNLTYLLNSSLDRNLTGLEFAAGVPGTVGGAIRGNAGTFGLGMSDVLKKVKYLDENNEVKEIFNHQANFSYRHSIFKEKPWIIIEAELELEHGDTEKARILVRERLERRQATQPNEPSAGCIFKNIRFEDIDDLEALKNKHVEVDNFVQYRKIPAAYLIEKAGLKGHTIGGAQISEVHANYIVNKGQATAEQVIMLISFIKQQIRDKYGIQLQEEVQIVL